MKTTGNVSTQKGILANQRDTWAGQKSTGLTSVWADMMGTKTEKRNTWDDHRAPEMMIRAFWPTSGAFGVAGLQTGALLCYLMGEMNQ